MGLPDDMIRASHDSATFAELVSSRGSVSINNKRKHNNDTEAGHEQQGQEQPKKKQKYQRIEEWDEEQKKKMSTSWEEWAQFDGLNGGDRFRQNELLRRQLRK